jgi:hypothetical protein
VGVEDITPAADILDDVVAGLAPGTGVIVLTGIFVDLRYLSQAYKVVDTYLTTCCLRPQ